MMLGEQLQGAIYTALHEAQVCGGRIYDGVPEKPAFPYITIGDSQVIDDGGGDPQCTGGWEIFEDIHIWSRHPERSKRELKQISAQVASVLLDVATVEDFRVVVRQVQAFRAFRDPDGITEHGVLTMRFLLDPAA
jgi:hypothetical protein